MPPTAAVNVVKPGQSTMQHKHRRTVLARHGLGGIDRADSRGLQPNTNLGARKRLARLIGHVRHQLKVTAIKHGHGLLHVEFELVGTNAHDKLATCQRAMAVPA